MTDTLEIRDAIKRRLQHDLAQLDRGDLHQDQLNDIVAEVYNTLAPDSMVDEVLGRDVLYEVIGLGPLLPLMMDDEVTEIMVNGPYRVFVERHGQKQRSAVNFDSLRHLRYIIQRILHISPGKRLDETSPMVDLSLPDGSRINVVIPPAAVGGPQMTIRKYLRRFNSLEDLVKEKSLNVPMAAFLAACVYGHQTLLMSGATGSGKSTLAEVLGHSIQFEDRIVVIEDTYELKFQQPNQVRLLTKPPNIEGAGEITIRDLFRNTLRMRPNRIILGEVRGEEAFDFLQAATSGHRGSIGVIHASNPMEALVRLENLATQAGLPVPPRILRQQVAHGIDFVVQIDMYADGIRRVTKITEVRRLDGEEIELADIFEFKMDAIRDGKLIGHYRATGEIPESLPELQLAGANIDESLFKAG